jgi:hypothetical protein
MGKFLPVSEQRVNGVDFSDQMLQIRADKETLELHSDQGYATTILMLDDPHFWGGLIDDERYLITAEMTTTL